MGRLRRSSTQYYFQPVAITDPYSSLQENMLYAPTPHTALVSEAEDDALADRIPPDPSDHLLEQKRLLLDQLNIVKAHQFEEINLKTTIPGTNMWTRTFLYVLSSMDLESIIESSSVSVPQLFVHHWMDALSLPNRVLWLKDTLKRRHGNAEGAEDAEDEYAEIEERVNTYFSAHAILYKKTNVYVMHKINKQNKMGLSYSFYSTNKKAVIEVQENEIPMITAKVKETIPSFSPVVGFYSITDGGTTQFKLVDRTVIPKKGKLKGVVCGTGKSDWLPKILEMAPSHPLIQHISAQESPVNTAVTCVLVEFILRWLQMDASDERVFFISPEFESIYSSVLFPAR